MRIPGGRLCGLAGLVLLVACGGGGSGKSPLVIEGRVVDISVAGGTATAIAGSRRSSVPLAADGSFTMSFAELGGADFVTIEVAADGRPFKLMSHVGAPSRLFGDGERTLIGADNSRLNLSSVTTAMALSTNLALDGLGLGARPASDDELRAVEGNLDAAKVVNVAALIHLLDDGVVGLPQDVDSLEDLAADPIALNVYLNLVIAEEPVAFAAAVDALIAATQSVAIIDAADKRPAEHSLVVFFDPNVPSVDELRFQPDGGGTLSTFGVSDDGEPRQAGAMNWSRSAPNELDVVPLDGLPVRFSRDIDGELEPGTGFVRDWRFQQIGGDPDSGPGLLSVTREFVADDSQVQTQPDIQVDFVQRLDADQIDPFSEAELMARQWVLPLIDPVINDEELGDFPGLASDFVQFQSAGTLTTRFSSVLPTWSIDGSGRLLLDYGSGERLRLSRVRRMDSAADGVWVEYFAADGRRLLSELEEMIAADASFSLSEAALPGFYHQHGVGTEGQAGTVNEFRLRFDEGGTGSQSTVTAQNGELVEADDSDGGLSRFFWSVGDDGAINVRRGFDSGDFSPCDPDSQPDCVQFDRRLLRPVARVGDRIWWIEDRSFGEPDENGRTFERVRHTRFYDVTAEDPNAIDLEVFCIKLGGCESG